MFTYLGKKLDLAFWTVAALVLAPWFESGREAMRQGELAAWIGIRHLIDPR
jgi:hypothetical protein